MWKELLVLEVKGIFLLVQKVFLISSGLAPRNPVLQDGE
jgi:hypothetical protein